MPKESQIQFAKLKAEMIKLMGTSSAKRTDPDEPTKDDNDGILLTDVSFIQENFQLDQDLKNSENSLSLKKLKNSPASLQNF